jgi:CRISPR-associated protein Cas5d
MAFGIKIEVWGDYALFTRPEMKVERVTYDIITPSAARGILDSIYWSPGMRWKIDKINVLSPIRYTNIRRNEVKSKISATNVQALMNESRTSLYLYAKEDIQQRASIVLTNVHYVIEAHFYLTGEANAVNSASRHFNIINRRIINGQFFSQPSFGCREFPANFRFWKEENMPIPFELVTKNEIDLGIMLYDMDYSDNSEIKPTFFRAVLKRGILDLTNIEVLA